MMRLADWKPLCSADIQYGSDPEYGEVVGEIRFRIQTWVYTPLSVEDDKDLTPQQSLHVRNRISQTRTHMPIVDASSPIISMAWSAAARRFT